MMSAPALYLADEENLVKDRVALLAELSASDQALQRAARHLSALMDVDREFIEGCDGRHIGVHIDDALRFIRSAYAVVHMIADKERP
jgi:hypothetical protein